MTRVASIPGDLMSAASLSALDYEGASERIRSLVWRTPLIPLSRSIRPSGLDSSIGPVLLKAEGLQATGSFKVRGAANFVLRLPLDQRARGIVACSSGNHGRAVAHVAAALGVPATICVPDWVDSGKLAQIKALGARAILAGDSYDLAEDRALQLSSEEGLTLVHPFDDPWIVEGQGTLGLEIAKGVTATPQVLVPLSGGGLISGVGAAIRGVWPEAEIIGVSAASAETMVQSVDAGVVVELSEQDTVAEALVGGIGRPNRFTFRWVQEVVDSYVSVSEDAIKNAMVFAMTRLGLVLEGGGAVALAALLDGLVTGQSAHPDRPTVVVLTGSNISANRLAAVATNHIPPGPSS